MKRWLWLAVAVVACHPDPLPPPAIPNVVAGPGSAARTAPLAVVAVAPAAPPVADPPPTAAAIADAKSKLAAKYPSAAPADLARGVDQVAALWRASDGDLAAFCVEQYTPPGAARDALFARLESIVEQIDGHVLELDRSLKWGAEVETGSPPLAVDTLLAAYDSGAHVTEDLFTSKAAFAILLNFPLTTLAERLRDGASYDRRRWAEVRLTRRVDHRIPGNLAAAASAAGANGDHYVAGYNLWMHHVLGADGQRRFPSGKRLISHWNLRDELKANYAEPPADGLPKQRTIAKVMERIVTQTIPAAVIDNPRLDWNPFTNAVTASPAGDIEADAPADRPAAPDGKREPDTRYDIILAHFHAARAIDPFSPTAPTYIDRAFAAAEMPEDRVRKILVDVLASPLGADVAKEVQARVGRPLEPQDLWFPLGPDKGPEAALDAITRKKYPTAKAFADDIPRILRDLGFTRERAQYLADHIAVDPSRGAGHAMEARRRGDKAHLRTRVEPGGMDYKGYNIAVHELGHNIEQTFSLYDVDHTLLSGVPNTAFTEALAFLFQARDLELLGRPRTTGTAAACQGSGRDDTACRADRARVLDTFWQTREIAGSALVEIDVWHWLYAHPDATAADLRDATVKIARDTWAKYYAPLLGNGADNQDGVALLGIYSHMLAEPLYLFNYVLGHTIAFQVEEHLAGKDKATFAKEFERDARQGQIAPDLWMIGATGKPVGAQPLLDATARALAAK
jgi:hypothetical protein|nr:hypothetical protein [Kofleriaceae bacterium]